MQAWVEAEAARLARRIERELEALVAVSSPSGDSHGAEEAVSLCAALLPADAETERLPSSTKGYAPDLLARIRGTGSKRVALLGHIDTVLQAYMMAFKWTVVHDILGTRYGHVAELRLLALVAALPLLVYEWRASERRPCQRQPEKGMREVVHPVGNIPAC